MNHLKSIIPTEDQYEVAKARAEIAFKIHVGCIVAFMAKDLIRERFKEETP